MGATHRRQLPMAKSIRHSPHNPPRAGAFAHVMLCRRRASGVLHAIKKIAKKPKTSQKGSVAIDWLREKEIAQKVDSLFVVKVVSSFETPVFGCLVMEYCGGGSVFDKMEKMREIGELYSERVCHPATVIPDFLPPTPPSCHSAADPADDGGDCYWTGSASW